MDLIALIKQAIFYSQIFLEKHKKTDAIER